MAAKTIIEINGNKYDAITGRMIVDGASQTTTNSTQAVHSSPNSGVIDGFQRPKVKLQSSVAPHSQMRKKPQKAQTLARNVVKKPATSYRYKSSGLLQNSKTELTVAETRRKILNKTPANRLQRADTTVQSNVVTRFSNTDNVPRLKVTQPIAVARENIQKSAPLPAAPPITTKKKTTSQPVTDLHYEHALARANSHHLSPPKKLHLHQRLAIWFHVSPKLIGITAACLAFIVLSGFFAYQKVPNLSMRVAASRAGFNGTIPNNPPSGYSFKGPIKYEKNAIILSYKSGSDNRQFNIVQRPSNWSSEALLTNYLGDANMRYQTYSDHGLTVYIMNGNNASWVNKGIWYTLNGTNTLSTEQVLSMAASM